MDERKYQLCRKKYKPSKCTTSTSNRKLFGRSFKKVYKKGWEAKTEHQFVCRIKEKLKEFTVENLQNLMKGVKTKLRKIADSGVLATYKK